MIPLRACYAILLVISIPLTVATFVRAVNDNTWSQWLNSVLLLLVFLILIWGIYRSRKS